MRQLVLLRGAPGCGKSTWIDEMGFRDYALSADEFRLNLRSPIIDAEGNSSVDQKTNKDAWDMLFKALEIRMENGDFTVIDACNTKTSEMSRYKDLAQQYKYRVFVVDFTDIPIEEVKQQNASRYPLYKRVPENVIDLAYSRFKTQGIPSGFTKIKRTQAKKIFLSEFDFSNYNNIYVVGDVHGCYTALMEFFELVSPEGIRDDDFYIFVGDYFDRGIENVEVMNWMLRNYTRKNFLFLEGNHEKHIKAWSYGEKSKSKEFEARTKKQFEDANVSKKEVRMLWRKLGQCAFFTYHDKRFFVSHGGIPRFNDMISTTQLIKGVGSYEEVDKVIDSWAKNMDEDFYQIFGHRNVQEYKIDEFKDKRCFLLEGRVEFGGDFRAIWICKSQFTNDVSITPISISNTVYNRNYDKIDLSEVKVNSISDFVKIARESKLIQEKKFGTISSFNFTRDAFEKGKWNDLTVTARGLYIDTEKNKIVLRGYSKFWNIDERDETSMPNLRKKLEFPVQAYLKENGFLGLVSVYEDELILSTKSKLDGIHNEWFKEIFNNSLNEESKCKLKSYLLENDSTAVFEVIDCKNDPHIIEYNDNKIILLDIIKNTLNTERTSFKRLKEIASDIGLNCKKHVLTIKNYEDFVDIVDACKKELYTLNGEYIEGYVFEDSNGYMTKLKTGYYQFWKHMRSISSEVYNKGYSEKTGSLLSPLANEFYVWLRDSLVGRNKEERNKNAKDIITLRKEFEQNTIKE